MTDTIFWFLVGIPLTIIFCIITSFVWAPLIVFVGFCFAGYPFYGLCLAVVIGIGLWLYFLKD